jgi:hypothetical protein
MQTNESLIDQTQRAMSADETTEREIVAKGLTAPRITLADLLENVVDVEIHKHITKSGQVLRWAILTTRCGFAVVGKPSCAVSAENDDQELGERVAQSNSRSELWPLMGYELCQRLHVEASRPVLTATTFQDRVRAERAELAMKVNKLADFISSPGAGEIDLGELVRMTNQSRAMQDYLRVLDLRIAFFATPDAGALAS